MTDFNSVIEKIKKDEDLKKQFSVAVKENKVAEFLKDLGVNTTKEEISAFLTKKKEELNDSDLSYVSGGACHTEDVICTIVALVLGCYMGLTLINEVFEDRSSCVTVLSSTSESTGNKSGGA